MIPLLVGNLDALIHSMKLSYIVSGGAPQASENAKNLPLVVTKDIPIAIWSRIPFAGSTKLSFI